MIRVKTSLNHKRIRCLVWLVLTLFVLLGYSLQSVAGNAYYSNEIQNYATVGSPPVILQNGTAGTSTIYTNSTSAKVGVTAPVWFSGWDKRVKITIDNNDVDSALPNFPVLIYLSNSSGRNNYDVSFVFDEVGSNSKKIAVTTSDGTTECYVEIEKWDSSSEQAWLWVKVPSVSNTSNTDLYLYYDNDHANNTAYVDDTNAGNSVNVWDSSFKMVQHMRDDTTSSIVDSTSNDNDGTKTAAGEPAATTSGKISDAQDFDGSNDYIDTVSSSSEMGINSNNTMTVSAWVNPDVNGDHQMFVIIQPSTGSGHATDQVFFIADNNGNLEIGQWGSGSYDHTFSGISVDIGVWQHFVITYDGSTYRTYKNGNYEDSWTRAKNLNNAYVAFIGSSIAYAVHYFEGIIDEVHISNTSRTAAWIKASYESGRDDLLDFGQGEDYVDNNTSNVDSSSPADKGTHSNFTAQQYGPDSIYDTLIEKDTGYNGFVWLDSPVEKTYSTTGAWTDLDLSGDVPSGATGVVIAEVADTTTVDLSICVRGKEDTNDYMNSASYCEIEDETWRFQIVKLNSDRVIQYYSENTALEIHVMGYTVGTDPKYKTIPVDLGSLTTGSWQDMDVTAYVDDDTDGVILFVQSLSSGDALYEIRAKGSTNDQSSREWEEYNIGLWVVKIDSNDVFQYYASASGKIYLVAETKGSIEYQTNYVAVTDPSTGSWQDRDLDSYITVPTNASGAIIRAANTYLLADYQAGVRKNGITWAPPRFDCGADQQVILGTGIDANNIFEAYYESTSIDMYIEAVTRYYGSGSTNYELDLEVQWTGVDYDEANEYLCIYGGNMASENLKVDVRKGSQWTTIIPKLNATTWNNVSVSSYLTSSTFTIRFLGANETNDTIQSSWNIDATLLQIWTSENFDYVLKVVNQVADSWEIKLQVYDNSGLSRLSNTTISIRNTTTTSDQIIVSGGTVTQSEGAFYDLPGGVSETLYIKMSNVKASTSGTSYIYTYLKIQKPNTTTYMLYVITFEIT